VLSVSVLQAEAGGGVIDSAVRVRIEERTKNRQWGDVYALTPREHEIVHEVALGYTDVVIGPLLGISVETVRTHVVNILAKLGLGNRTQIALYAVVQGLIEPHEIHVALDEHLHA
jgi:DNA-binding NarL/FixJ family response regulator